MRKTPLTMPNYELGSATLTGNSPKHACQTLTDFMSKKHSSRRYPKIGSLNNWDLCNVVDVWEPCATSKQQRFMRRLNVPVQAFLAPDPRYSTVTKHSTSLYCLTLVNPSIEKIVRNKSQFILGVQDLYLSFFRRGTGFTTPEIQIFFVTLLPLHKNQDNHYVKT
jgi:hypothetical protein